MNKNLRKIICTITAFTFITLLSGCTNSKPTSPSNEKATSIQENSNSTNTSATNNSTLNNNSSNEKIDTNNPNTTNKSTDNTNSTEKKGNITPSKNNNSKSSEKYQPKKIKGKKQFYLNKLDSTKNNLHKHLKKKYAGSTLEMRQAAEEEYMTWDKHLNEIYSELKKDLPSSTMNNLKKEQIKWISYRDSEAKKHADSFKGGSFMPVQNLLSLGNLTKQRCYELVNKYMD